MIGVLAQTFQQRGAEHDVSVLTTLPAADVDHHASAVDIGNLQASQLGAPYPRGIERHQYHAMKPSLGAVDEGNKLAASVFGYPAYPGKIKFRVKFRSRDVPSSWYEIPARGRLYRPKPNQQFT